MDTTNNVNEEALYTELKKALSKNYEIKWLGKGAYGQVFKAKCRQDDETYAIKVLPGNNKRYQKRELEALIRLNLVKKSRNILEYVNSWFLQIGNERILCIQMELCWGDLISFVFGNTRFGSQIEGTQFYRHVFQQILNGLIAIHSIGWVHRDIHPGNILIVNSNPRQICDIHVKIGDFGLAKNIKNPEMLFELTPGLSVKGKPEQCTPAGGNSIYTAPEFCAGTYDEKVDLYSVGAVLYFIARYPEKNEEKLWMTELKNLDKTGQSLLDIHKDDKILWSLIKDLRRRNPEERPSASAAKKYMFPQAKDSIDGEKAQKIKFFVRTKNDEDLRMCSLSDLTFSALKAEAERRTCVKANKLRQVAMINGEKKSVIIKDDEDVENIFENAAEKAKEGRYVEVVVTEKTEHNSETTPLSSGDTIMCSASPTDTI